MIEKYGFLTKSKIKIKNKNILIIFLVLDLKQTNLNFLNYIFMTKLTN